MHGRLRDPSSAASSAGRASWRPVCPSCAPAATRCCGRRPRSPIAPAMRGSRWRCPCGRAGCARCCARRTSRRSPTAARRSSSTTPRRSAIPAGTPRAYAAWQRLLLPAIARRARRLITVSEFSRRELAELLGVDAAVVPGGVDDRFAPGGRPGSRAPRARPRAPVRADRGEPHGPQEPRRARPRRAGPRAARGSTSRSPAATARSSRASRGSRACGCWATSTTRCCPGSTLARSRSLCRRSTRVSDYRCSRRWHPGRPSWRPTPARCRRRAATPPCWPRRTASRSRPRSRACSATPASASASARPACARAAGFSWNATARAIDEVLAA